MKSKYNSYEYRRGIIPQNLEVVLCAWKKISNEQYANKFEYTVSSRGHQCWACHGYNKERCSDYTESREDEDGK